MRKLLLALGVVLFMASCTSEPYDLSEEQAPEVKEIVSFKDSDVIQGKLLIKFTPDVVENMPVTRGESAQAVTGFQAIDAVADRIGATGMKHLFDIGGKFEERQRESGLHLWYEIAFDESVPATQAVPQFSGIEGVDIVEPVYILDMPEPEIVMAERNVGTTLSDVTILPFNDPRLVDQWHYENDGTMPGALAGSDINLFDAWTAETGKPEVIVAVIDMGVDATHEDLAQNMWNDGNGHYGRDFVNDSYNVPVGYHGTHVAGTIAAVNNNGVGVSGIAGGNGSLNSGVRIMSCHIGLSYPDATAAIKAFQYAAENGAVIAQCSWGVQSSTALQAAITYFVMRAGLDEYGIQTGPMRGGLVVVSAGNTDGNHGQYPAVYPNVLSVASIGPAYAEADYTTYHSTVDLSAPGGDTLFGNWAGVLSTMPDNEYGWLQGTSMASPHVSGVAALVISKFGGYNLTPEGLKQILFNTSNRQALYFYNPTRTGLLGEGLVDAASAVMNDSINIAITGPEETSVGRTETYTLSGLSQNVQSIEWSVSNRFVLERVDTIGIIGGNDLIAMDTIIHIARGAQIMTGQGTSSVTVKFNSRCITTLKAEVVLSSGLRKRVDYRIASESVIADDLTLNVNYRYPNSPGMIWPLYGNAWRIGAAGIATVSGLEGVGSSLIVGKEWSGHGTKVVNEVSGSGMEFIVNNRYPHIVHSFAASVYFDLDYKSVLGTVKSIRKEFTMPVGLPQLPGLRMSVDEPRIGQGFTITLEGTVNYNYTWAIIERPSPGAGRLYMPAFGTSPSVLFRTAEEGWYTVAIMNPLNLAAIGPEIYVSFYVNP